MDKLQAILDNASHPLHTHHQPEKPVQREAASLQVQDQQIEELLCPLFSEMKEECRSFMAALSVNVVTVNMFLSVFFLPGVLADCYQKPAGLSITAPKDMEALSGSCLRIPCSFTTDQTTFNIRGTIYGVWIKSDQKFAVYPDNVVFNSSKSTNIYQMKITGNLSQKNCTTLYSDLSTTHTDKYFFRVENGPFRATACDDPIQITVKDSAWKPRINFSGELKEKESVTITCSAFTPCPHSPPELTWNLQQNSHRQIEENTDGTFTAKIQETITLSDTHDGYTINCSVRYPVNEGKHVKTAETEVTLSVSKSEGIWSSQLSTSVITVIIVVVVLICLVVSVWCFKSKHPTPHQTQSQTGEDLALQTPATKPEEELHYEEMNFRKRPEPSSVSVQDSRQQQETVYAQVKVSEPENSSTQTADSPEDLYAQVKKK
ncbi:sialic acid-binding Ig-like lectin 14 [Leuresthes tenuis]|uniref:sialic acid-binding Ig-like lectin 14 n=1 Tax=Leuresthes tenuis TaxID=355514 RepID=UPI003B50B767